MKRLSTNSLSAQLTLVVSSISSGHLERRGGSRFRKSSCTGDLAREVNCEANERQYSLKKVKGRQLHFSYIIRKRHAYKGFRKEHRICNPYKYFDKQLEYFRFICEIA